MIGRARAQGAISIVNAIASGRGATVAVDLPTTATVTINEEKGRWRTLVNGEPTDSSLSRLAAEEAIKKLGKMPTRFSGMVETVTSAPVGVGLKTSSSSSVAVALATFAAFGRKDYAGQDILDCSVSASLKSGASVTGALDDAASSLLGGVNLADNRSRQILSSTPLPGRLPVLIRLPRRRSRRKMVSNAEARRFADTAASIFGQAMGGKVWRAMTLNGLLYSSIYGYPSSDSLQALESGAIGAGLSGTGPAVAAVFDEGGEPEDLKGLWEVDQARVIWTETSNGGAMVDH